MWRVASEAYAYLAGHPFLTDTEQAVTPRKQEAQLMLTIGAMRF